ncbi:hypothetical protein DSECCO2_641040 [anaerobic digester metagenome]
MVRPKGSGQLLASQAVRPGKGVAGDGLVVKGQGGLRVPGAAVQFGGQPQGDGVVGKRLDAFPQRKGGVVVAHAGVVVEKAPGPQGREHLGAAEAPQGGARRPALVKIDGEQQVGVAHGHGVSRQHLFADGADVLGLVFDRGLAQLVEDFRFHVRGFEHLDDGLHAGRDAGVYAKPQDGRIEGGQMYGRADGVRKQPARVFGQGGQVRGVFLEDAVDEGDRQGKVDREGVEIIAEVAAGLVQGQGVEVPADAGGFLWFVGRGHAVPPVGALGPERGGAGRAGRRLGIVSRGLPDANPIPSGPGQGWRLPETSSRSFQPSSEKSPSVSDRNTTPAPSSGESSTSAK